MSLGIAVVFLNVPHLLSGVRADNQISDMPQKPYGSMPKETSAATNRGSVPPKVGGKEPLTNFIPYPLRPISQDIDV